MAGGDAARPIPEEPMRRIAPVATLALIAAACFAQGCLERRPSAATVVSGSLLADLPRESVGLLVVQVSSLRDRGPVAAWLADLAARSDREGVFEMLMERAGPEILDRLDRIALAAVPLEGERLGFALLAEGGFDGAALRASLGGEETLTVLEVADQPDLSVAVIQDGAVGLGPRVLLDQIRRNAADGSQGLGGNRPLISLLERLEAGAPIWGVIDYAPMAKLARGAVGGNGLADLPLPGGAAGASLQALAFQGTIDDPIEIDLVGQASLEDDAARLADAARGLIAIGRLAAGGDGGQEALISLLDTLRITQSGPFVNLHGSVPVALLTRLTEGMAERRRLDDGPVGTAIDAGADDATAPPGASETVP
jgi:hypothetical protein